MTFLEPTAFYLSTLLFLIGLSFLLRMPRRRLRVPDSGVAKRVFADKKRTPPRKRTLISLAIQLVIFALLLIAAAKPYWDAGGEDKARNIIVLLDVSASMGSDDGAEFRVLAETDEAPTARRTRLDSAVAAVRGLVRDLKQKDRLMLIAVARTADVVFNFEKETTLLDRWLAHATPRAEGTSFHEAAELAVAVSSSLESCEIYVVTDGAVDPDHLEPLASLESTTTKLFYIPVGQETGGNLGITNFRVRKNLDSPSDYEALVVVINTFVEDKTVTINLLQDGKVIDTTMDIKIPGRGRSVQVFREKLYVGGILEASLRVADSLPEDNRAREILIPSRRLRVLLVSKDTSDDSFFKRAIGSNPTALKGASMTPTEYAEKIAPEPGVLHGQLDAVVFDRWVPDDPAQLPPIHLLCIDCVPPVMPAEAGKEFDKPLIRTWDKGHPLMTYLNLRNVFLDKARRLTVKKPGVGERPVERVAELVTSPLVVSWERYTRKEEGKSGQDPQQRLAVVAMDPNKSDIAYRKELPLFMWNSFGWFQTAREPPTQAKPGHTITLEVTDASEAETMLVKGPGGLRETVPIDAATRKAVFGSTGLPGIYHYSLGEKQGAFAVNVGDPRESDVCPTKDLLQKAEVLDAETLAGIQMGGRQLWPILLWIAALLLGLEAILFHRRIYF